jgi:uncharacterized protein (DUF1778 family)
LKSRKPRKQLSGGAKLKAAGRKPLLLGVTAEQLGLIRQAAAIELRPVTQFVTFHVLRAAERIIASHARLDRDLRHHAPGPGIEVD